MLYALITGASKGIGRAIAGELAARKINLLLVARSESLLREVAHELEAAHGIDAHYLAIDLAEPDAAATITGWLVANSFTVHILVNNAGYGLSGAFDRYLAAEHEAMMRVNMHVPVALCRLMLPQLKQQSRSYILNIVSSAAYQAVPGLTVYAASKAFMLNFSRGLGYELRNTSVSVTAISPGATDTDFVNRAQVSTKARKAADKLNMTPQAVASMAVNAMFAGKAELVTGMINKLGAFMVWLLPKKLVERTAAGLYDTD